MHLPSLKPGGRRGRVRACRGEGHAREPTKTHSQITSAQEMTAREYTAAKAATPDRNWKRTNVASPASQSADSLCITPGVGLISAGSERRQGDGRAQFAAGLSCRASKQARVPELDHTAARLPRRRHYHGMPTPPPCPMRAPWRESGVAGLLTKRAQLIPRTRRRSRRPGDLDRTNCDSGRTRRAKTRWWRAPGAPALPASVPRGADRSFSHGSCC